jgi:hypothetical protein
LTPFEEKTSAFTGGQIVDRAERSRGVLLDLGDQGRIHRSALRFEG